MKKNIKRIISAILVVCLMMSVSYAEEQHKDILKSIGDWVSHAWNDSTKWLSQAWIDSSKWVSQAWSDSTTWVAGKWSGFVIWIKTITYDNPYSWIRDMVLDEGILAYDEFVSIRTFLSEKPDSAMIKKSLFDKFSELSLLNEDKDTIWEIFSQWAEEHKVTTEQIAKLSLPFVERLIIEGEEALGEDVDFSGPVIAQYLIMTLEAMKIGSHEDAESRLNALKSSLDSLTRPIVIGDQDQNIVITEDGCYIENFTYSKGKYPGAVPPISIL